MTLWQKRSGRQVMPSDPATNTFAVMSRLQCLSASYETFRIWLRNQQNVPIGISDLYILTLVQVIFVTSSIKWKTKSSSIICFISSLFDYNTDIWQLLIYHVDFVICHVKVHRLIHNMNYLGHQVSLTFQGAHCQGADRHDTLMRRGETNKMGAK